MQISFNNWATVVVLLALTTRSLGAAAQSSFLRPFDDDESLERKLQQGDDECGPPPSASGGRSEQETETRRLQTTCPEPSFSGGEPELWNPLTLSERNYVQRLLESRLDLESNNNPFLDDTVRGATLEGPDKTAMLAYLDDGGPPPDRYARGTVYHGSLGYIMEYVVGPLAFPDLSQTVDADVTVTPVREPGEIPLTALPIYRLQYPEMNRLVNGFTNDPAVASFLEAAFGDPDTISWTTHEFGTQRNRTNVVPISWYRRFAMVDNILSHPLPLEVMVEFEPYDDPSQWRLHSIIYNQQFFPEVSDFVSAINDDSIPIKELPPFQPNPFWQTLEKRPSIRPNNCDAPAQSVDPGARFTVNGGRVSWLGWSFYVTNHPRTATAIYDVKFLGQRIAYELSLQELQAVYSGRVPSLANKFLYDTNFYPGATNRGLVRGVDCPNSAYYSGNTCIFEHDKGSPIWRKDGGTDWYAGAKATHLVVRAIFEVGNYDYIIEFKFGLDGQVDIGLGATGQLFLGPYDPIEEPFGTRVQEHALANIHAHYAGFKVDLDVLGVNNCVEKESMVFKPRSDILPNDPDPAWNVPQKNLAIERERVLTETEVIIDNMVPTHWKVVSCSETNRWGYLRGYEVVHPNTPLAVYKEAFPGYQEYHAVFAQRKESEPFISTQFDSMTRGEPYVPITGPNGISNGESLEDQDVVAWVGLGFYHLPRAEDNSVTNTVYTHFSIRPFNYFDENSSLDVGQATRYRDGSLVTEVPEGNCAVGV